MKTPSIIQLISGPRNISTALMYSFGNRRDTAIVDEPFYSYYLTNYKVEHPGKEEIMKSMSPDEKQVIDDVIFRKRVEAYFFVKNMAQHIVGFDYSYSYKIKNVFLIRDPKKLIASFAKVISKPTGQDIGLKREVDLYNEISEKTAFDPVVVDSGELLKNPPGVIREMCEKLEIPFDSDMLSWKAGPRDEDGVWAKHWYKNVHNTIGFTKQKSSDTILDERLIPLYEEVLPYYNTLFAKAIKA